MAINSTLNSGRDASSVATAAVQSEDLAYQTPAEGMPAQHVAAFSINYDYPFLKNEKETQNMLSAVNAQSPGTFQSIAIYTSKPSCGLNEARLVVATYAQGVTADIDGAADGSISQISTLDGITSPESTVTPTTLSGLPARRISYRAKRWGGVLGGEFIVVSNPRTNTFWQLQLIFSARNTNDYAALSGSHSCAQKILESAAIENGELSAATLPEALGSNSSVAGVWTSSLDGLGEGLLKITEAGSDYLVSIEISASGCLGAIDGTGHMIDNTLKLIKVDGDSTCEVTIDVLGDTADVSQKNCSYYHGAACSFSGTYKRTR